MSFVLFDFIRFVRRFSRFFILKTQCSQAAPCYSRGEFREAEKYWRGSIETLWLATFLVSCPVAIIVYNNERRIYQFFAQNSSFFVCIWFITSLIDILMSQWKCNLLSNQSLEQLLLLFVLLVYMRLSKFGKGYVIFSLVTWSREFHVLKTL